MKSSCKEGARHLHTLIFQTRFLPEKYKEIIDSVIQRNGYFAHPENVLLSMLTDAREEIRELAQRRILKAKSEESYAIRKFEIPKLNFDAKDYIDLINWMDVIITVPPVFRYLSKEDITLLVTSDSKEVNFADFPCHTQAVERCVKLVTEASAEVCGENARDGYIRARLQSRRQMPCFNTKVQFLS